MLRQRLTIKAITQVNGSVAVLTPIGIGGAISGGNQWRELSSAGHSSVNNSAYNIQPSILYTTKLTELGNTTFEYAFEYCKHCSTSKIEQQRHCPFADADAAGRQRGR